MNIFLRNLSFKTTEQELQRTFETFGEVRSVNIITDHNTLKSRRFAFVEMQDRDQALAAIAGINGKQLTGQIFKVNEAKPREARDAQRRERSRGDISPGALSTGGEFGHKDRSSGGYDHQDANGSTNDSEDRSGGGSGKRGRGGRGSASGGRPGGADVPTNFQVNGNLFECHCPY
jgi:RNA recognition motif-containing protein